MDQDGKMTNLQMTSEDEQQILSEKPALRQIYEAQVRLFRDSSNCSHICPEYISADIQGAGTHARTYPLSGSTALFIPSWQCADSMLAAPAWPSGVVWAEEAVLHLAVLRCVVCLACRRDPHYPLWQTTAENAPLFQQKKKWTDLQSHAPGALVVTGAVGLVVGLHASTVGPRT